MAFRSLGAGQTTTLNRVEIRSDQVNRASHPATSVSNQMAMLSVMTHATNQTEPIRARLGQGLVISHALPTQALPGITEDNMINNPDELIEALDELIEQLDRYHKAIRTLIDELKDVGIDE